MTDLIQAMATETVDTLKQFYTAFFGARPKQPRKAEIIQALAAGFADPAQLNAHWQTLGELEQQLIQECIFTYHGRVDRRRFTAKYGQMPEKPKTTGRRSFYYFNKSDLPDSVALFFYPADSSYGEKKIPDALITLLKPMITPPVADTLDAITLPDPLPADCTLKQREVLALNELSALLILLQNKQLKVGEKTGLPSGATLKKVAKEVNEYYQASSCREAPGMEFMVSYGWTQLIGNSPYCKQSGTTLLPARKTTGQPAEIIKSLWEHWIKNRKQDEFRRIDNIKGQNGKGKRYFTDPFERRQAIISALQECPPNQWITFDSLSRYMFVTGSPLVVTTEPEYLYLYDPNYGMLNKSWSLIESRYLRCFLVEYAATLGLIDVIMAPPETVNMDNDRTWGTDDMDCLSRYDGLRFIRLTSLGAFVLGLSDNYQPSTTSASQTPLTIHRKGRIVFVAQPTPWERQFLARYAEPDQETVWQLSNRKIIETLQVGGSVDEIKQFLLTRETQPFLPEDCESFLNSAAGNIDGVKFKSEALIFTCKNQAMAELISNDKVLARFCQRLDELQIVLPKNKEKQFRDGLYTIGIGCI